MLTEAQKDVKIAYLEQENSQLRSALLDSQILTGKVALTGEQPGTGVPTHPEEGTNV